MDARCVECQPDAATYRKVDRNAADAQTRDCGYDGKAETGGSECDPIQGFAIADRHDQNGADIVEDCKREQEQPQAPWYARTEHRKAPDDEGRIGDVTVLQPLAPGPPPISSENRPAGTAIPPRAAATGRAAMRGLRNSPSTSSRFSSRAMTKKKSVISRLTSRVRSQLNAIDSVDSPF